MDHARGVSRVDITTISRKDQPMTTTVRAGNMLNEVIAGDAPIVARAVIWIAYYPLMHALAKTLDRFERGIRKQYEPIEFEEPPPGWVRATRIE